MRWMVAVAALALLGCSSAGKKAADEYEIVSRSGGAAERCQAARKAEAAYLSEKDEKAYREWKLTANIDCLSHQLDQSLQ